MREEEGGLNNSYWNFSFGQNVLKLCMIQFLALYSILNFIDLSACYNIDLTIIIIMIIIDRISGVCYNRTAHIPGYCAILRGK